jgi:hypothetical protein
MATSEERVVNWNILVNQWKNEHSLRDELSHHLVFTKNDEEPGSRGHVCLEDSHLQGHVPKVTVLAFGVIVVAPTARL